MLASNSTLIKRGANDGFAIIPLSEFQENIVKEIKKKISFKHYNYLDINNCPICNGFNFEIIAEKDRYGLPARNVLCLGCGFVFQTPVLDENSQQDFYANYYRLLFHGSKKVEDWFIDAQFKHAQYIKDFLNNENSFENKTIVEVGCAAGGILLNFKKSGARVIGCDYNPEYEKIAHNLGIEFTVGNIGSVDIPDKSADLVILSHVLEHVVDPTDLLSKIKRILKPGGHLFIEVPGILGVLSGQKGICGCELEDPYDKDIMKYLVIAHTFHFDLTALGWFLEKSGFKLINGDERIFALFALSNDRASIVPSKNFREHAKMMVKTLRNFNFSHQLYWAKNPRLVWDRRLRPFIVKQKFVRNIFRKKVE